MAENTPTADVIAAKTTTVERVEIVVGGREGDSKLGLVLKGLDLLNRMPLLKTITLVLLFLGAGIGWTQREKLGQSIADVADRFAHERTDRVHATALTDAVLQHREIGAILSSTRDRLGASRVLTWGFHNGTESLRGLPFLFVSATAEVDAPGFSTIQDKGQRLPLATVIEWIPTFLAHQCIDRTSTDSGPTLRENLEEHGTIRVLACPIYPPGRSGEPFGFVSASYVKGWSPDDATAAVVRLQDTATLLGSVLGTYLDKVQRPNKSLSFKP